MQRISFSQGQTYSLDGHIVEVLRRLEPNRVQLEHRHTSDVVTEHVDDLLELYTQGRLVATDLYGTPIVGSKSAPPVDLSHFTVRDRHETFLHKDVVGRFRRVIGGPLTRKSIAEVYPQLRDWVEDAVRKTVETVASLMGPKRKKRVADEDDAVVAPTFKLVVPSKETIYQWERKHRRSGGDPMAFAPEHRNKGPRSDRLSPAANDLMHQLIRDRYLTRARMSMRHVYGLLKGDLARLNRALPQDAHIPVPSYATFRSRIRDYSEYEVYAKRFGEEAARRKFQHRGVGEVTFRIQQRYEVDHVRLDVIVIDRKWRIPLGRPWLTLILDGHSRMVVGYYIGFHTPNSYSVLRALKNAVLPKNGILKRLAQIVGSWPCWGIFEELVCDNGLELHGGPLRRAAAELGFTITFCGARDPQSKGRIERFFRTLNDQLIHLLPGTTRSNTKARGTENPAHEARIHLDELEGIILKYLVEVYMRQHHGGLGDTPIAIWEESAKHHPPLLPGDAERLKRSLSFTRILALSEKGVCFDSLQYTSHELTQLRRHAEVKYGPKPEVIVKIDPDDLMTIHVALKDQPYLKVPHVSPEYAEGLTMDQHRAVREHDRRRVKATNVDTLLESKLQLQAMVDALYEKPKAGRSSADKLALKGALKAVTAFSETPEASSAVKKAASTAKKIGSYINTIFQTPHLDSAEVDYDVTFEEPDSPIPARREGGGQ